MPSPSPGTSSAASAGGNGVVFSDPAEPFVVKPIVEDLLRTRYCIPETVFLVEGVESVAPIRRRYRAVRLLVSDGVSCLQAILKGDAHGLVDGGLIYAGCYVRVESFELRFLDVPDRSEGQGHDDDGSHRETVSAGKKRKRRGGEQKMVYLVLENPVTVGWNTTYLKILESRTPTLPQALPYDTESKTQRDHSPDAGREDTTARPAARDGGTLHTATTHPQGSPHNLDIDEPEANPLDQLETPQPDIDLPGPEPAARPSSNVPQHPSSEQLPWATDDPTKPVKLTPLRMIPNLPYKQNWMVNVLAVVASISDVEPSHLPPYHQRTARLTDPSTSKQVLLTVFLDPDDFHPAVGSVVLVLGVKNHRFDGGSLKKYASDRPKNGTRWWFEEPDELGWCDVAGLRGWWDSKRTSG